MSQTLLHSHLFTRRREQQPLLGAASTTLPWFDEWMEALLGLDGLLLQPTVENMTAQQQVGERGSWDGMGGRSTTSTTTLHTAASMSLKMFNWELQSERLQGSRLRVQLCLEIQWLLFEHRLVGNFFQKLRNIAPICTRGAWIWCWLFRFFASLVLLWMQRYNQENQHKVLT